VDRVQSSDDLWEVSHEDEEEDAES